VTLRQLRLIASGSIDLSLEGSSKIQMAKSQAAVQAIVESDAVVYGINTGFGRLASTQIPAERLAELQRNLVLSHSVGTGEPLSAPVVRMVLATKAISLARGHSGIRIALVEALLALYNAGWVPYIPAKGSVGASGDLAPLAHLACVLIGEGQAFSPTGELRSGREAMAAIGMPPFVLGPKEGLALLNGTQVSTSLALAGLFGAEQVLAAGLMAGALSLEAIRGSISPFDARIHEARGQWGQMQVAAAVRNLLEGSDILPSHIHCGRVQDPYSIRCIPQVMGACLDNLHHCAKVLQIEANAASDNPLVFDNGDVISGGNFHAEPVAFAADHLALAVAEIGAISERRLALLLDSAMSGLPPFLVADSGVNSGFMIAQVTAAALASENKSLAHPGSVDSLPTSANQEDHVSMATYAARRVSDMVHNTAVVVGIEAMAAAQGLDLHPDSLPSSPLLEAERRTLRQHVPFLAQDRFMAHDIEAMKQWALQGTWPQAISSLLPSHQN
jgi:histidine ammonia-lyase